MKRKYIYRFYDKFIQDNKCQILPQVHDLRFVQDSPITKIILVCFYASEYIDFLF